MDKKLKNEIMGQALRYYYVEVVRDIKKDAVTAKQFIEVAMSVLNSIDINEIISVRDEL